MSNLSCKELIDMFQKIGGKLHCNYNTKKCALLPQNIHCNIQPNHNNIGMLLWELAIAGQYDRFVTILPETNENKRIFVEDKIHDFQRNYSSGFIIEFAVDKDGTWISPSQK